jgi:hypothetical protein
MAIAIILGIGSYAYADWGRGYGGHHGRGYFHHGYHHGSEYDRGFHGRGYGCERHLNEDERQQLDEKREAFFKATKGIREEIYQKKLTLRNELAKDNPDSKKAAELQKEISELLSRFDQKRIEHMINVKKINPDIGKGYLGRYDRGHRPYHGGGCW